MPLLPLTGVHVLTLPQAGIRKKTTTNKQTLSIYNKTTHVENKRTDLEFNHENTQSVPTATGKKNTCQQLYHSILINYNSKINKQGHKKTNVKTNRMNMA